MKLNQLAARLLTFTLFLGLLSVMGCSKKAGDPDLITQDPDASETDNQGDSGDGSGEDGSGVDVTDMEGVPQQLEDVFFEYDMYELRGDARRLLQGNARYLKANSGVQVMLEGHCDERGTNEYNLALGQRRADAVKAYLVDLGVPASRVQTISYGEERPFAMGAMESAWRQNRRVHFRTQ